MQEKVEKISDVGAEKEKQPGKGGERKYVIPEFVEGIDADRTFLKIAAAFGCYREALRLAENDGVPFIECEQLGLQWLAEDVLADLDLLIYGKRNWMKWLDPETKERENDKKD